MKRLLLLERCRMRRKHLVGVDRVLVEEMIGYLEGEVVGAGEVEGMEARTAERVARGGLKARDVEAFLLGCDVKLLPWQRKRVGLD